MTNSFGQIPVLFLHGSITERVWVECLWLTMWRRLRAEGGVWSWVPTDENPADLPTQGTTIAQLSGSKIWWNGPHWLQGPETEWPKHPKDDTNDTLVMMAVADSQEPEYLEDIVNPLRTSKYLRTLRSVA